MPIKKYGPEFKAKVALEMLSGESSTSLASKYDLNPAQVRQWKQELVKNAACAFMKKSTDRTLMKKIDLLYKRIGELTMKKELDDIS